MKAKLKELLKHLIKAYKAEIDLESEVNVWMFVLEGYSYENIREASQKWMRMKKWMPTAQDIYQVINGSLSDVKEWTPKYDIIKLWDEEVGKTCTEKEFMAKYAMGESARREFLNGE